MAMCRRGVERRAVPNPVHPQSRAVVPRKHPVVCSPRASNEKRLVADGARVYIEPSTALEHDGALLVLGLPSYVSRPDSGPGRWRVARDSIFGALILANGSWRSVPRPPAVRHPFAPRAVRRSDGAWDVVLLELPAAFDPQTSDSVIGIWHATLRDTSWSFVERVAVPNAIQPRILQVSNLVRAGDTLTWAAPYSRGRAGGTDGILLLERLDGRWTWRTFEWRATWVDLLVNASGHRRMVETHANDSDDSLTLRLLSLSNPPRALAEARTGYSKRLHVAQLDGDRAVVSYRDADDQLEQNWRAITLDGRSGEARLVSLRGGYEKVSALGRESSGGVLHWLADDRKSGQVQGSLKLLRQRASDVVEVAEVANPFLLPSPVFVGALNRYWMIGPAFAPHASSEPPWTATLSVGFECRDATSR